MIWYERTEIKWNENRKQTEVNENKYECNQHFHIKLLAKFGFHWYTMSIYSKTVQMIIVFHFDTSNLKVNENWKRKKKEMIFGESNKVNVCGKLLVWVSESTIERKWLYNNNILFVLFTFFFKHTTLLFYHSYVILFKVIIFAIFNS